MYGSIATMNSSVASARSSRCPPGDDSTGLPALVTSARIWPSPAVSISSASTLIGSSPPNSGLPETRERQRANPPSKPRYLAIGAVGGLGAPRIEHDHLAAPRLDRLEAPSNIGRGHQAAVRRERVRAEADEQVAAIDVGHRHQ